MKVRDWIEKLKTKWEKTGYTCDGCQRELFDYPHPRFCEDCLSALVFNDENTCEKCGRAVVTEGVCLSCKREMPAFDKGFSPLIYHGETAGLVNRLKRGDGYLARPFAEWMIKALDGEFSAENTLVTFVPLDNRKKRLRGYDQAEKLAKRVAKELQLPLVKAFVCVEKKQPQKELTVADRKKNVEGKYRVALRKEVKGKRIILVDDIMTTGATGNECACRLKGAGAEKVYFLTVAALPERK